MSTPSYGITFGKFCPLHNGHINMINQAATKVDKLFVILSYNANILESMPTKIKKTCNINNRIKWLKLTYANMDHIEIRWVDETNIRSYPDGWDDWVGLIKESMSDVNEEHIKYIFGSEPEYSKMEEYYPNAKYICTDRSDIHISATKIRSDIYKNWEYLPIHVRRDFVFKVCVNGMESSSKTTMSKYLASTFNTIFVPEYGREFTETELRGDESMITENNMNYIAMKQYMMVNDALGSANKVIFGDTNAHTTQIFSYLYFHKSTDVIDSIVDMEDWDIVLFINPTDQPWVDDGVRINGPSILASDEDVDLLVELGAMPEPKQMTKRDYCVLLYGHCMEEYVAQKSCNVIQMIEGFDDVEYASTSSEKLFVRVSGSRSYILHSIVHIIKKMCNIYNDQDGDISI